MSGKIAQSLNSPRAGVILTDEEFVNAVFEPQEQVNEKQAQLLGAALDLAMGGPAQVHVGTGSGGSGSDLPWGEKKKGSGIKR